MQLLLNTRVIIRPEGDDEGEVDFILLVLLSTNVTVLVWGILS